ncbi:hypothetical protein MTR67_031403 [Solanum verrucosum]|uniref:Uncharacterized protein n=1 Tax=Solanum verrucosum TaxID=315347 RepID=A0AAF0U2E6_SOLVR|nr:hypothetical protein MTR67_031403 [Solanum verrucosum]
MEGEQILLKVSPMKGVMRFGERGKLSPMYIEPFEVLKRVGKKPIIRWDSVLLNENLSYEEEPIAILDGEIRNLRLERFGGIEERKSIGKVTCLTLGLQWSECTSDLDSRSALASLQLIKLQEIPGRERLEWEEVYKLELAKIISSIRARKLVRQCYLAHVWDVEVESPSIESVPMVSGFKEVFPTDFPNMPPDRDIDFCIDLKIGTRPISIPPYRMGPTELRELKAQNQELYDKGFIRPSASPWGAPVLVFKKKEGSTTTSDILRHKGVD